MTISDTSHSSGRQSTRVVAALAFLIFLLPGVCAAFVLVVAISYGESLGMILSYGFALLCVVFAEIFLARIILTGTLPERELRNRVLRVLVGWLLPPPVIVFIDFLVGDLFYFNNQSFEYIRPSEDPHLWLIYLLVCGSTYLTLGHFLLAFSLLLEFGRRKVWRYCVAGVTGITISWLTSHSYSNFTRWHILEVCSHFLGCTVAVMLVAMLAQRLRANERSGSKGSLLP